MPSPNPGGRPKALHDLQELARQHTEAAIDTLAKVMNDEKAPHGARLSAAEALLSRGWGRPILPTVNAGGSGQTESFEDWLDNLTGPGKQMIEDALADYGLADREPDGSA